ncbi:MAG: eukaryotic-like serine/threonine-protein kinase [Thermotogota bacterium]|nr:eukaryotic-like serine/threonine-protein kinase [Thermotogota bacterium]MDK2863862.1 eukaryotic-like serine/threonine-protein kinase [Thermotogota bacterium]HCZ07131.1 hypothetical protein [Thermotogota bacterium]
MRTLRWILRFLTGLLAGFLFSLVIIWLIQFNNPHVEVPELIGRTVTEAREMLKKNGLGIQTAGSGEYVVSQYPPAGQLARKGRRVYVHLGRSRNVEIPDVSFLKFEDAAQIIEALGFEVDPTFVWSDYEPGIVLGTYREKNLVKVLVSRGKRWIGPAPDMRFLPLKLAEELCEELGIDYSIEKVLKRESLYPSGVVVQQTTLKSEPKTDVRLFVADDTSFTFFVYTYFRRIPFEERVYTLALPVLDIASGRLIALIQPEKDGTVVFGWMGLTPLQLEVIRWRDGSGGLYASTLTR